MTNDRAWRIVPRRWLATAGLLLASVAVPVPAAAQTFEKAPCAELDFKPDDLGTGVECGWLSVSDRHAMKVRIAVVIARATGPDALSDPVLYLHGGPGIATLDVVPRALRGKSWPLLRARRDLIFFDQRGTGRSTPRPCPDFDKAIGAIGAEPQGARRDDARKTAAARACKAALRAARIDPRGFSSTTIADDAEALRTALGIARWNLFATSYGTFPATALIRRNPASIRSLMLDSAFTPNSPNRAEQITGTAEAFGALQRHCDAQPECRALYSDLRVLAGTTIARLNRAPVQAEARRIDGDAFMEAVWTMLVDGQSVAYLPETLRRAAAGDDATVRRIVKTFGASDFFGGYSHAQAWLVNCHDAFERPARASIARAMKANADLAGDLIPEQQDRLCTILQPASASSAFYGALPGRTPTLILFGEFDPATPLSDARAAQRFFEGSTLIEIPGASHAPFYTDACTKSLVVDFVDRPDAAIDRACLAGRAAFRVADEKQFDAFLAELPL